MPPIRVLLPLLACFAVLLAVPSALPGIVGAPLAVPSALAAANSTGGTLGDAPDEHGGVEFGTPDPPRAVARVFSVKPAKLVEGHRPRIRLRIEQPGERRIRARVVVQNVATHAVPARMDLGSVPVGRTIPVRWPRGSKLPAGRYVIRVHARDGRGAVLARAAHASGKAFVTVKAKPKPKPKPKPRPKPSPAPAPAPSPAPTGSGVFPVRGPYSFGGEGSRFGAGRTGHTHEGQDIAAAEGQAVVSPLNGTVAFVDFQKGGAGNYVVINADDGRSLFFAHLQTGSITVTPGSPVRAGAQIADVGTTGSSTGPHLHFEIWEGGWRDRGGHPIDPLPQLKAWAS
ncbi:MAG TPA: M23 family metallopeptidase [Solirubrobacteraceae bacterium]|jgi:murein DD-endopeptidase MepM/ murein hydrolase activator NlpD